MKALFLGTIFQVVLWCHVSKVHSKLEPTKFQNQRIYALENQHSGKYLSAGENGEYVKTGDHGTPSLDQRWRFRYAKDPVTGLEGWQFFPLNGKPAQPSLWREIYVEHGKFQFQNKATKKCLDASSAGMEEPCNRENHFQRWYPYPLTE